jgi:hypothetical protein
MVGIVGETCRLIIAVTEGKRLKGVLIGDSKLRDLKWAWNNHVLRTGTATVD